MFTYALFEEEQVVLGQGIGFSYDRDKVDTRSKTLHDLDVKRLQSRNRQNKYPQQN